MRWLVVDDDAGFASLLVRLLQREGYEVSSAESLEQAWQIFQAESPDKMLLDLNLDNESGLSLLKQLQGLPHSCDIVVLTGYASIATTVEAMRLGAMDYLCKPATLTQILTTFGLVAFEDIQPETDEDLVYSKMSPKRVEWEHIQKTLLEFDGNISATARALNMHRRTLQRKLQKRPAKI